MCENVAKMCDLIKSDIIWSQVISSLRPNSISEDQVG